LSKDVLQSSLNQNSPRKVISLTDTFSDIKMELSFGVWLKQRRRILDLTQEDLAHQASCSIITIRKIESSDLAPSKELARQLALALAVPELEQAAFIAFARTDRATALATAFAAPSPGSPAIPRLPTPAPSKFHLPAQMTAVIGRERDAIVGCKMMRLPGVRLMTLTGPPGTGKTRLSLEIAEALQPEFEHGACFVPLAPLGHAHLVEAAIAQALGVHEAVQQALLVSLQNYLRDKRLLLVLDNFEHVLPAAPVITELLAAAPGLKVLVSSREALRLYGERELPVSPLALPELNPVPPLSKLAGYPAIVLFEERAQASKPDFELTPENGETVARICANLDGLPLAIEMAAAQVKWRPPQTLLAQLKQSLTGLSSGLRHLPPRQQTLHGAIEWSYSLLVEDERHLFNVLGVFAGGCTREAVEAVWAGAALRLENRDLAREEGSSVFPHPSSISTQLVSLVDKNLLRHDLTEEGEPRFWMLETMREYAREQLVSRGQLAAIQQRHALYYLSLAEGAGQDPAGTTEKRWLDGLEREHDNLRAALSWALPRPSNSEALIALRLCGALGPFWRVRGHWSEGNRWIQQALELDIDNIRPESLGLRATALYGIAMLAREQGNYESARIFLRESLQLRRELGDKPAIVQSLVGLGWLCCLQADRAEGRAWAEEGWAISQELGEQPHQRTRLLNLMGYVALCYDDHLAARTYYEASLTLSRQTQDKQGLANALTYLGICAYCLGDYVRARLAYAEGLALRREVGDLPGVRHSLNMSALCAIEQGDDEAAGGWLQESLALAETLTEKAGIAMALRNLGWLALWQGDLAAARRWINESLTVGQSVGDKIVPVRLASWSLAELELAEGNYAEAGSFAEKWLHVWGEINDREDRGDALRLAGFAALGGQGDYAAARRCFEECLALRQSVGHQPDMAQAWLDLGYVTVKEGHLTEAARCYAESLRLAQQCNHKRRLAFALRALAALASLQGQPDRAARLLGASETVEMTLTARLRSLPLLMQQDWADDRRILQTQLGEAPFAAAQQEGHAMSLEQAVAYALTDLEV
jgi:predicted ATPase/transcriptional regulator with XRE-family HTH domain/Tfp pilus assembly protein PilF